MGVAAAAGHGWPPTAELVVFLISIPAWLLAAGAGGLYHLSERRVSYFIGDEIGPIFLLTTSWIWILAIATSLVSPDPVPLLPLTGLWMGTIVLVLLFRATVRTLVTRARWWKSKTILVGTPGDIARVAARIERHPEFGIDVAGSVQVVRGSILRRFRLPGGKEDFEAESRANADYADSVMRTLSAAQANHVIVTDWPNRLEERTEFLGVLIGSGIHVDLVSGEPDALASTASLQHLEGMSLLTIRPHRTNKSAALIKRGIDVAGAGLALLLLSPLLLLIALRIKMTSKGPVIFKQERIGREGAVFEIFKFRTMVADADARKGEVAHLSFHADGDPRMFKIADDPRVTRFGSRLRKWSLDELPQLCNVLIGDMSLVGPRPLIPEEACLIEGYHAERSMMRPGITGPWQTLGRSGIPFAEMVRLDYTYVSTWTVREDLRLLMRTVGVVFRARGAY